MNCDDVIFALALYLWFTCACLCGYLWMTREHLPTISANVSQAHDPQP